jgi:DNA binding domain, excisionase family
MKTYSVKDIAELLKTNPETVRRWIRSGKLEAVQDSRKEGNVITQEMLDSFLTIAPKYAGTMVAGGMLAGSLVGLTTLAAGVMVSAIADKTLKEKNFLDNSKVTPDEIKKLLFEEILKSERLISGKKKSIQQLEKEIETEQQRINETKKLIKAIDGKRKEKE